VLAIAWAAVTPLFLLALVMSTVGWYRAVRRRATRATALDVGAGLLAAGGALLLIGTDAGGIVAAVIAIVAALASVSVFRIAVARGPSRD
jgi:hypothetical protein